MKNTLGLVLCSLLTSLIVGIGFYAFAQVPDLFPVEVGDELNQEQLAEMREEQVRRARKLQIAYRSEQVKASCTADPTAQIPVTVAEESILVDCLFWNRWNDTFREEEVTESEPAPTTSEEGDQ